MSAGRPRTFEEQDVLVKATEIFWERGYEGTGLTALLDHIGMARQSLYNVFGDKRGLYLKILNGYAEAELARLENRLAVSGSGYDSLCDCLLAIGGGPDPGVPAGCMIVNAACEFGSTDAEVATIVQEFWDQYAARLQRSLEAAVAGGDLPSGLDARRCAWALTHAVTSMRVMQKAKVPRDRVFDVANSAIEGIAVNAAF